MKVLVADCETDGLLDELTKVHCLCFVDAATGEKSDFADQPGYRPIAEGLKELAEADVTVWHNAIRFDIPALRKVYPWFKPRGIVRDTLVMASLIWPKKPTLLDIDTKLRAKGKLPGNLMGLHSLKAWGHRLGNHKGDYTGGWEAWSPEMHAYMLQDISTGLSLWLRCLKELETWPSQDSVDLEHEVAWVIARQERWGFKFNEAKAAKLLATLTQRKTDLEASLSTVFPPKIVRTPFTPKRSNKTKGWIAGVTIYKEKEVAFKPSSRKHVAERLMDLGWQPGEFGMDGVPKVDDDILQALPYPQAKVLAELFTIDKRIGQLSTGSEAWLRNVKKGRIHGAVSTCGAVTRRMTHFKPNVAQVPKEHDYRELFEHSLGCLVGCDADSLEGRVEAGYTVRFDGGAYMDMILNGDKAKGTDLHSVNAKALCRFLPGTIRDTAKTFKYATTYGCGDWKAGWTLGVTGSREKVAGVGKKAKAALLAASPGLGKLTEAVKKAAERGWVKSLDGGKLVVRKAHAAINTVFQSAGAIVMKKALVILDTELTGVLPSVIGTQGVEAATNLTPGVDFEFAANVHDEFQIDTKTELADTVGQAAAEAITKAGAALGFRCPMVGNYDIGPNWAATH